MKSLKLLPVIVFVLATHVLYAGTPLNDAGISTIISPYGNFCSGALPIRVILNTYGSQELDSVTIGWSINDSVQKNYKWYGHMKIDSNTLIIIGSFHFSKGTYNIKVWTENPNGLFDSVADNDTAVLIAAIGPNAGGKDSICLGNSVTLGLNLLSGDSYTWTSNPPGFTSTDRRPMVSPKKTTTYYLKDSNTSTHCVIRDTAILYINPSHPVSAFTVNQASQCFDGNSFVFTDKSVILGSVKSDTIKSESIVSWAWDFGDKGSSKLQNPTHSYSKAGTYIVKLKVSGMYGCKDSLVKTVIVHPMPSPVITGSNSICIGTNVMYQTKEDSGSKYDWYATGGTITSGIGTNKITIHWPGNVTGTVDLTETTVYGCIKDASQMYVTVLRPQMASFQNACIGQPFTFFDQSTVPVKFLWRFGDGDTSDVENPTHIYNALGKYTVNLKVTSSSGCQDSVSQIIKVNPLPDAHWKVASILSPSILFKANDSTQGVTAYDWDFGDGTGGSSIISSYDPSHIFPKNKAYLVKLSLTDNNGCYNEQDSTIDVKVSGIEDPLAESLNLNIYPNPFQNSTVVEYNLARRTNIKIELLSITGIEIYVVSQGMQSSGEYQVEISDKHYNLSQGIYILKFTMDGQCVSRNIVKF